MRPPSPRRLPSPATEGAALVWLQCPIRAPRDCTPQARPPGKSLPRAGSLVGHHTRATNTSEKPWGLGGSSVTCSLARSHTWLF